MGEIEDKSLQIRMDHVEKDIADLKNNDKDIFKEMSLIKESHVEIMFYSKQIQESQSKTEKNSERNQEQVLKHIQDLKDKPIKNYEQIKIAIWIFAATYILGSIFGMIKIFTPK